LTDPKFRPPRVGARKAPAPPLEMQRRGTAPRSAIRRGAAWRSSCNPPRPLLVAVTRAAGERWLPDPGRLR
jgi:hypothetical protein